MARFEFPDTNGVQQEIYVDSGHTLFIVGANGSGKSSLLQRLFTQHSNNATRISAHRQTWFTSNTLDFTPTTRKQTDIHLQNADAHEDARWRDDYASQRLSAAVFDLINADNIRSRKIADKIDLGALEAALSTNENERTPSLVLDALAEKKKESPLKVLNELLRIANLPIDISIENREQLFATRLGSAPYSIAELSDGERNAILIGASVLTAKPGSVVIIDEPERHLHRSIASPLLSTLFQKRSDCVFVISTHDVSLPLDSTEAKTLLVRSCTWQGRSAAGWDTDLIESDTEISEDVRRAILGARRVVLFVEGIANSLDKQIYDILFPAISIIPKGDSTDVERATKGVRATTALNWITAYGLIDADDRTPGQLQQLELAGVYGLNCHSVESLYYHPEMISRLAVKQSQITGEEASKLERGALDAALASIRQHKERMCARRVEKKIRQEMSTGLPDHQIIAGHDSFAKRIDLRKCREDEHSKFDASVATDDVGGLIARYPIRETQAPKRVASQLNFQTTKKYEMAVRETLVGDPEARTALRELLGGLAAVLRLGG